MLYACGWYVLFSVACVVVYCFSFFFFQAEDGIRDLVRSRGLGDVYKRQSLTEVPNASPLAPGMARPLTKLGAALAAPLNTRPVSYTHLTLPTSDLV